MNEAPGRREATAGAWAAAAIVFALGGLGFAVAAHLRLNDLQQRVDRLEASADGADSRRPSDTSPSSSGSSTSVPALPTITSPDEGEPTDVESAKALVTTAFTTVYQGNLSNTARLALVDNPSGVDAALTAAATGENAGIVSAATARVGDIVFTSPTRATVQYTVVVPGQAPGEARPGEARLSSGTWKVTRATVCGDLATIGAPCD